MTYLRFSLVIAVLERERLDFSCLDKISIKRNLRSQWIIITNKTYVPVNQITDQLWAGAGLNVCFSIPSSNSRHGQNYYLLANLKNDSTHSYEIDNVQCRISKSLSSVMKLKDINTAVIPNYSLIYISALYFETVLKRYLYLLGLAMFVEITCIRGV